ncbi:MAG: apolipoprotein N-acyltransferase [Pseudomonadota bacterium]
MIAFLKKIQNALQPENLEAKSQLHRKLIIFFCGALSTLALQPFGAWPLFLIAFSIFYLFFLFVQSKKQAFIYGWLFGFGYFVFGLNWIGNALLVNGNEFWWAWPFAVVALPIALSIFTGIGTLLAFIIHQKSKLCLFYLLCIFLSLSEFARGFLFTGFPWNLYGHIWIDVPLIAQSASLFGAYGLTFTTLLLSGIPIALILGWKQNKTLWLGQLSLLIVLIAYGAYQLNKPQDYNQQTQVQVVQPNIKQADKWNPVKLAENFEKHVSLSAPQEDASRLPTMVIWPETAISPPLLNSIAAQQRIKQMLGQHPKGSTLVSGALIATTNLEGDIEYTNSVIRFDQDGFYQTLYSKSHLVPFGEYIPFQNLIPLKTVTNFSGFARGQGPETIQDDVFGSFSPFVCYETIFAHKVANHEEVPEWLLNVTNDAWYGNSPGPYQHLAQSRFRAIEQGLPFVRSANTGISSIISPTGEIKASLALSEQGLIVSKLSENFKRTVYSRFG